MSDKVKIKYNGGTDGSIHFKCPGVLAHNVNPGDIISGVPKEVYEAELKDDPRFSLVSEKSETFSNKKEKQTFSKGE